MDCAYWKLIDRFVQQNQTLAQLLFSRYFKKRQTCYIKYLNFIVISLFSINILNCSLKKVKSILLFYQLNIFCITVVGLLLLFGAYLAWETRHVHIQALNDSKLIGLSVYNVVVLFSVVVPVESALTTDPTVSFALLHGLTIFTTTFTICVVFIPKVSTTILT